MPTPDDVMLSPPAEHELEHDSHRTTCPPDESRIHADHDALDEQSLRAEDDRNSTFNAPAQQPTPPPAEPELLARAHSPSESHTKNSEVDLEAPMRDIPTPISATDEGAEEQQRASHASQLSATAPVVVAWHQSITLASPFPKQRVRSSA